MTHILIGTRGGVVVVREIRRETDHAVVRFDEIRPGTGTYALFPLHTEQYHFLMEPRLSGLTRLYEAWFCRVPEPEEESLAQKTHPRFTITCESCGSTDVVVDNTIGFSPQSGAWGSLSLDCSECGNSETLWEPL